MHSALISAQSAAFDRFVNSAFKEAAEFHAELEVVSEETFILFAQYAYTGSYELLGIESKFPEKTAFEPEPEPEPEPTVTVEEDHWGFLGTSKKKKKRGLAAMETEIPNTCRYDKVALWKEFASACSIAIDVATRPGAVSHDGNILLSHARLYVFADCYDMPRLADISIDKLGRELLKLNVMSEVVTDIIELLRYAYK